MTARPFDLRFGDCIEVMRTMPDNSVDSIVTDPPYELGFMGRAWDSTGIANSVEMWREALRVLKPGGHLLAFSGSRTYHRMACAIEDAGFDIRDQIMWVYGSGFPKSMDVSKALEAYAKTGRSRVPGQHFKEFRKGSAQKAEFSPTTDAARQWYGWGTALKPAHEPICMARKPLIGTVAANVLAHGTGALNIDVCRVEVSDAAYARNCSGDRGHGGTRTAEQERSTNLHTGGGSASTGRWPANLIHDGNVPFPDAGGQQGALNGAEPSARAGAANCYGAMDRGHVSVPREETDKSAARFFYCAKASKADRGEGNTHPTVKPTALMAYLCRLVTPPGGIILDPFMGSGSTGKGAVREGFKFFGIDMTPEYLMIAATRISDEWRSK